MNFLLAIVVSILSYGAVPNDTTDVYKRQLDEYVGQKHLVGEGAVLRKMIDAGRISSFILWGPPGVGRCV